MERDTDAPGGITWTTACLLKMPSYQGLGPVMLKRGPYIRVPTSPLRLLQIQMLEPHPGVMNRDPGGWAQQAVLQHMFYTTKCEKQTGESGLSV